MNNTLSNEQIIFYLRSQYGFEVIDLTPLAIGADINASIYKAQTQKQLSYFVKLSANHDKNGIAILDLLQKVGIEHIIPPIKTLEGKPTSQVNDITLIVYPFIAGHDGFNQSLNEQQWQTLGKTLKRIHDVDMPRSLQQKIKHEAYSPKWRDILRLILSDNETAHVDDEIALKLYTFIQQNLASIHRLVDRAEQLAEDLKKEQLKFILCHSDLHAGNIFIDEKNNAYIIDWDAPIIAPKERDLMFIGGGVGNVWNKPNEENLFYEGYGDVEINVPALAYYRHERVVQDIVEYCQEILFSNKLITDKIVMHNHFINMFSPKGVIEIAFATDEKVQLLSTI